MSEPQIFQMIPVARSGWLTVGFIGALVILLAVFFFMRQMVSNVIEARVAVSAQALSIQAWPYGRTIPLADLDLSGAREVDLRRDFQLGLKWKTNGMALSGIWFGWWRMKNGEKALAFVTDKARTVYLPTRGDFAVLVSVADPQGFLAALSRAAR